MIVADLFQPVPGGPEGGNVSVQTWVPDMRYYDEVVRRNNVPGKKWALVTLTGDDEIDNEGAIPVNLG